MSSAILLAVSVAAALMVAIRRLEASGATLVNAAVSAGDAAPATTKKHGEGNGAELREGLGRGLRAGG